MVVEYCTAEDVAKAGVLTTSSGEQVIFGENLKFPTEETINDFIEVAEEWIENETHTAFGTKERQVTDELHDFWPDPTEASFHLNFAPVLDFSTGDSDKLECWDGSNWIDYITTYTEGRGDSFFVDYSIGKVYFYSDLPKRGKATIRVTYRCNSFDTVPKAIKMATALYVNVLLAATEYATILYPEGEGVSFSVSQRISKWEKLIKNLIEPHIHELTPDIPFEPTIY